MRIRLDPGWAQSQVDSLRRALPRMTPPHLERPDARRRGDEFSLDTIFSILSHLRQPAGISVDYVYSYVEAAGCPVPYLRKREGLRLLTHRDLLEQGDDAGNPEVVYNALECDRSPEGYFELVLFRTMAMQFYLFWHANYNDATVIASRQALASSLTRVAPKAATRFRGIDPTPCVAAGGEGVVVHVLTSSRHTGLCRESFQFSGTRTNKLRRRHRKVLAEPNVGVMY